MADSLGRKPTIWLYYLGALIVSLCLFLLVRDQYLLLMLAAASGFFLSGQMAWMTIYLPELFPTRVRGTAMSLVFDSSRFIAGMGPLLAGIAWGHRKSGSNDVVDLPHRLDRDALCRAGNHATTFTDMSCAPSVCGP
jgi:MFS family permease